MQVGHVQIADWSGANCAMAAWPRDDHATILNRGANAQGQICRMANAQGQIRWQFGELQMGKWV